MKIILRRCEGNAKGGIGRGVDNEEVGGVERKKREEKRRKEKRREEEEFAIEDKEGTENTEIEKRKRSLGE